LPIVVTALVLCAAYSPLLFKFFRSLWFRSHYQHFPFVLAAFGWLLCQRFRQATPRESTSGKMPGWFGGFLYALAWVLLALAYYVHSPWLAVVSAIMLFSGFLFRFQRVRTVQNAWGIWLLLWLIVPLPTHPDQQLIAMLQRQSSRLSSLFLDWIGIPHLMAGNVLHLAEKQLFVDEACSGIVSLMSIVACAIIYSVWNNRSLLHLVFLTLAGVGWATLMNVTRICIIAFAFDRWGVDWSGGLPHELLGLAVFLMTFLALVSTDLLLLNVISPISSQLFETHGEMPKFGQFLIASWDGILKRFSPKPIAAHNPKFNWADFFTAFVENRRRVMLGIVPLLAFAMLGGIQFVYGDWLFDLEKKQTQLSQNASVLENASAIHAELLPARCATFNRIGFELKERESDDVFGKYSQSYEYQDIEKNRLLVSCDYPFSGGWHELAICYQGVGWEQTDRRIVESDSTREGEKWNFVEISFSGREGANAFLIYCQFDENGRAVAPPTSSFFDYIRQRLSRPSGSVQGKQFFQVQVWTNDLREISEEQREEAREVLLETREKFRDFITN